MTLLTFECKKCKIVFEGETTTQTRPRKACPRCHKAVDIKREGKKSRKQKLGVEKSGPEFIDEKLIEKSILDLYNKGKLDVNLIRLMVDYVLKVRGKAEEIDEDLDMEMLKSIGISTKDSD